MSGQLNPDTNTWPQGSGRSAAARDYHDRAVGMVGAVVTGRAEQHPQHAAMSATAHDEKIGRSCSPRPGRSQSLITSVEMGTETSGSAPEGTLVAIHATGTPGAFFRWASPAMTGQVRKSITGDLDRLRSCLET